MSRIPVGSRVIALSSATQDVVYLIGRGTYDGDYEPPTARRLPQDCGLLKPRITLDDGQVVWGMDCIWGPEAAMLKLIGSRKVASMP